MDGSLVLHHDEKEDVTNPDDILVRRLKNRERQRRYRARKRHEADLRRTPVVDQTTPLHYQQVSTELLPVPVEVEISVNVTSPDLLTRVHCRRDWKRDARRVRIQNKEEINPTRTSTPDGSSASSLECGLKANTPIMDSNATHPLQSSRRHWKAEARNKKSSE